MVEGDYKLSVNNCRADAILAAQSVVENGWVARGGRGKVFWHCSQAGHGVVRRAAEGCLRTFYLSFEKHKGGGKHVDCGSRISQLSNSGSPSDVTESLVSSFKNWEEYIVLGEVVKFKLEFCFNRVTS